MTIANHIDFVLTNESTQLFQRRLKCYFDERFYSNKTDVSSRDRLFCSELITRIVYGVFFRNNKVNGRIL